MPEGTLFDISERLTVEIGVVASANPTDIHIFGGHWGERTYYADYAGIAAKYKPNAILEIGVRFGYSGIALCFGALFYRDLQTLEKIVYHGLDGEFFGGNQYSGDPSLWYKSNEIAEDNFRRFFPGNDHLGFELFHCDTQKEPIPELVLASRYDLVNVDGDHSYQGAMNDMVATWPLLNGGGLMLVDDMGMVGVYEAVYDFIRQRETLGEPLLWQLYKNERDMMIIRKGL